MANRYLHFTFLRGRETRMDQILPLFDCLSFTLSEQNSLGISFDQICCEKQLYKRLCPSVGPSVRGSVRNPFLKYRGNGK